MIRTYYCASAVLYAVTNAVSISAVADSSNNHQMAEAFTQTDAVLNTKLASEAISDTEAKSASEVAKNYEINEYGNRPDLAKMACNSKNDKMGCLQENPRCMWLTTQSDVCSGSSGFGMCVYVP